MNYDRLGLIVALGGLAVSIWVGVDQAAKSRDEIYQSRVQARASTCTNLAAHYAAQSWQYAAVEPDEFELYGLAPETKFYGEDNHERPQPNQLLEVLSNKAIAAARAIQICINSYDDKPTIDFCLSAAVDSKESGYWVDDDTPPDQVLDRPIC